MEHKDNLRIITHNEGTITGSKEHVYTEFILVGGGNLNHGGQVIKLCKN